jgi:ferredoxin-NADP reductase/Na+-translocating ferredoxin:NAD+ oxidoreductase RnfD subunit
MKFIDDFLNSITMYRLILYYLILLLVVAAVFCIFGILPYNVFALASSVGFLILVCWITNTVFAKVVNAHTNIESVYISALILALIISPIKSAQDFMFLGWAAVLTMASKYILAIGKKHIFNPVAVAVVITALAINQSASWWVGTFAMFPAVVIGGVLIVRKIRRLDLVWSFFFSALTVIVGLSVLKGVSFTTIMGKILFDSPIAFFAFVMLTEPLTTPPTASLQMWYGAIVGVLFAPQIHVGSFYTTPELALVIGNIFSYLVSPKDKLILTLKEKLQITPDTLDFIFTSPKKPAFSPGQYMEWTLSHPNTDSRGNRRYFTLASSPTEDTIRLGIKFYAPSSSYKKALLAMKPNETIVASQLAGDFTLMKNPKQKYVFIAGGIGITPFRSIIQHLLDTQDRRQIIQFFANKTAADIVYTDVFNKAYKQLGIKTVYTITDPKQIPPGWQWYTGRITPQMIEKEVPDYKERMFYLSGPRSMVTAFEQTLSAMGIQNSHIKTDFFPGFA